MPASGAVVPVANSDSCLQEVAAVPVADNDSDLQGIGKDMLTTGLGDVVIVVTAAPPNPSADMTRACLTFGDGWMRSLLGTAAAAAAIDPSASDASVLQTGCSDGRTAER